MQPTPCFIKLCYRTLQIGKYITIQKICNTLQISVRFVVVDTLQIQLNALPRQSLRTLLNSWAQMIVASLGFEPVIAER